MFPCKNTLYLYRLYSQQHNYIHAGFFFFTVHFNSVKGKKEKIYDINLLCIIKYKITGSLNFFSISNQIAIWKHGLLS